MEVLQQRIAEVSEKTLKDPKSQLQEYLQSRKLNLPVYQVKSVSGDPHNQVFVVKCVIDELNIDVDAQARSRRNAEQSAAQLALKLINSGG